MPLGMLFWLLFIIWVLVGGWVYYQPPNWRPFGGHLLLCLIIFVLGWSEFGFVVSGR